MPVIPNAFRAILSKSTNSKVMAVRRREIIKNAGLAVSELSESIAHPIITIAANEVFMRFVPEHCDYLKNYGDVFRLAPNEAGDSGKGIGGYSDTNRFTGVIGNGVLGLNGSYWGKADGIAGEDAYYSMWKDYDGNGPPRLMAKYGHVMVQRARYAEFLGGPRRAEATPL